jgi:hypothetical protein
MPGRFEDARLYSVLEATIGIVTVVVLLGLGLYLTRGGGTVPGGVDDPARPGPYGPVRPPEPIGSRRKSSRDSPSDSLSPDAEAELWQRERERYQKKDQTP